MRLEHNAYYWKLTTYTLFFTVLVYHLWTCMDLERGWVWLFDVGTFHVLSVAPRTGIGSIYTSVHVYVGGGMGVGNSVRCTLSVLLRFLFISQWNYYSAVYYYKQNIFPGMEQPGETTTESASQATIQEHQSYVYQWNGQFNYSNMLCSGWGKLIINAKSL